MWHDENWTNEIFLTMNKKVMFFIHCRLQETKIFYHKQISHENIQWWIFQTTVGSWLAMMARCFSSELLQCGGLEAHHNIITVIAYR